MLLVRVAAGGCQINARNKHGKLKTVGDHHQQEKDKMEEQQKTEQEEERGRMAEMRAFESGTAMEKLLQQLLVVPRNCKVSSVLREESRSRSRKMLQLQ